MENILFIVSTPRHLYQAIALACNSINPNAYLFVSGLEHGTRLLDACSEKGVSPFKKVHFLDKSTSNSKSSRQFFKSIQSEIGNFIRQHPIDHVYFGNDFKPLTQWIMYCAKAERPHCQITYMDEGIASYFYAFNKSRKILEWFEGRLKSITYGSWYERPKVLGSSKYVDNGLFTFPDQIQEEYRKLEIGSFPSNYFSHARVKKFIEFVVQDQDLKDKILNIDVLILLPSMNLVDTVYKDIRILRKLLEDFKKKNLVVGIKYHPKDKDGNAVLDAGNQFTIVPTYLPAEIVFSLIDDDAIIIGDVSSALFSAKWLLPKSKIFALIPESSTITDSRLPLFKNIGVEILRNPQTLLSQL